MQAVVRPERRAWAAYVHGHRRPAQARDPRPQVRPNSRTGCDLTRAWYRVAPLADRSQCQSVRTSARSCGRNGSSPKRSRCSSGCRTEAGRRCGGRCQLKERAVPVVVRIVVARRAIVADAAKAPPEGSAGTTFERTSPGRLALDAPSPACTVAHSGSRRYPDRRRSPPHARSQRVDVDRSWSACAERRAVVDLATPSRASRWEQIEHLDVERRGAIQPLERRVTP
jgi:hypothetical protein